MNLSAIIAKFKKDGISALTLEEKAMIQDNIDLLSDEDKAAFEKTAELPGIDEKSLIALIQKSVKDGTIETKSEEIAKALVSQFMAGVKEQRAKFLETGDKPNEKETARRETQKFLRALVHKDAATLEQMSKAVTTATNDTAKGGYLIPSELHAEVLRIAETMYGVARREFFYLPFTGPGNSRTIPTLSSGVTVTWTDEATAKTASVPVFGVVTQTLKKLAAIIPFSEEIIEDSAINLTQLVATLFAEAVSKEEDTQFFDGSGSPWTGILRNASVNRQDMTAGDLVENITADDLLDMIDKTPAGALPGAKFYMHRTILSQIRKLKDPVTGQYIYQRPSEGLPGTIWNYPYELVEAMPSKTACGTTANKGFIIFGNLKLAAYFGDKQQIRAKLLDQATITDADGSTTINLAQQDMIALRLEERVGYVLALPTAVTVLRTGASS